MHTIFMNSENGKTSNSHRLLLNLSDKLNLKRIDKCVALSNLSICYAWKNIKKSYKNNKCQKSAPTWNEEFELPDGTSVLYSSHILYKIFKIVLNISLKT